jgi:hypothetical protein
MVRNILWRQRLREGVTTYILDALGFSWIGALVKGTLETNSFLRVKQC